MRHALITTDPLAIVREFGDKPARLVLENGDQVEGVGTGWSDGTHRLVRVERAGDPPTPFHAAADGDLSLDGDVLTVAQVYTARPLADVRAALISMVKRDAEIARGRFITKGDGKAMVYIRKDQRARECLADLPINQTAEKYPLLAATIPQDGEDVVEVANAIVARAGAWEAVAGAIESTEAQAVADIGAAKSVQAAHGVYAALTWPEPD